MAELKRDICKIGDSTKLNSEIIDLDQRLEENLPEHLRYASRFWFRHLLDTDSTDGGDIYNEIKRFFSSHLLHWMEVMSLINDTGVIITALGSVKAWIDVSLTVR